MQLYRLTYMFFPAQKCKMAIHRQWTRLLTKTFDAHFLRSSNQYTCRVAPRNSFQQTIISNRCRSSSIFFRLSTGHVICGHENNGHKRQTILSGTVGLPENCCELREFSTDKNLPIIYLFTKEGCTLCDVAVEALKPHMHRVRIPNEWFFKDRTTLYHMNALCLLTNASRAVFKGAATIYPWWTEKIMCYTYPVAISIKLTQKKSQSSCMLF